MNSSNIMSYEFIVNKLRRAGSKKRAKELMRFFKTGPGEYGEGDIFIGVSVPQIREIIKTITILSEDELLRLITSKIHEERLAALLYLVRSYKKAAPAEKNRLFRFYLKHTKWINNWDLVDISAHYIVGEHLLTRKRDVLEKLASSKHLWERRIAIVATFAFIRNNEFEDTERIAKLLLNDTEDLMHKAVGWMLREVAKRDEHRIEAFLRRYYDNIPRTTLRYAIERFPKAKRVRFLKKRF